MASTDINSEDPLVQKTFDPVAQPQRETSDHMIPASSSTNRIQRIDSELLSPSESETATFLQVLLANRAAEILGIVAAGGTTHREVAVMSEYVGADYHGRFLVELLQNANDQARNRGATVTIIREPNLIAVTNEGEPLQPDGASALTSLGLSSKDPSELIGNKGIGFKAVYEVTRSPEFYSAPHAGESFRAAGGFAFRISMDVFAREDGESRLNMLVGSARHRRPEDARRLDEMKDVSLAAELRRAAPFKFPIGVSSNEARERFDAIGGLPEGAQSLVVLPLDVPGKAEVVERAIDELLAEGGVTILFLPGIARLRVLDRVRGLTVTIVKERRDLRGADANARHALVTLTVEREDFQQAGSALSPTKWQVVESEYGGLGRPEQAATLNAAARALPGSRYDAVDHVPVAVALRQPVPDAEPTGEPHGRICIGLPTLQPTGTPAWVSSHFFGSISRKDVDFTGCEFNRLLFDEALRLHGLLIERLRRSDSLDERRLATLAFNCRAGNPLADALLKAGGQAHGKIVLLDDGATFASAVELLLPRPENFPLVRKIVRASSREQEEDALPDEQLVRQSAELLHRLAGASAGVRDEARAMFERGADGMAVVERAATVFRHDGPEFWEPFLNYCIGLDPTLLRLRSLKVIPVANERTVSTEDGVFLPPVQGETEASEDEDDEDELQRDLMDDLPPSVLERLKLVDVRCLRVRQPVGRKLTPLGERLSPASGGGLLRRPRLDELLNTAIIPAIEALAATEADLRIGLSLLRLATELMGRMKEKSRKRVSVEKLKVPAVCTSAVGWRWVAAEECYFGEGWLDEPRGSQLASLYRDREGALLFGWKAVSAAIESKEREEWRQVFAIAGVHSRPRILRVSSKKQLAALFHATYGALNVREPVRCPIDGAQPFWAAYLQRRGRRATAVHTGQLYGFDRVTWIDGLDEERAPLVVAMILREPSHYEAELTCGLGRDGTTHDSTTPRSLWVDTLRHMDWPVIPTSDGACRPSESWIVRGAGASSRQRRFDLMHRVKPDCLNAARILAELGVGDLERPSVEAISRELERVARLANAEAEGRTRQIERLAEDLYARLQDVVAEEPAIPPPPAGSVTLLPLLKDGRIIGVPTVEIARVFCHDDPNRAEFVPGIAAFLRWPISTRAATAGFARWLRAWLGESAVLLTSEAEVETGFVPASASEPLLDWLRSIVSVFARTYDEVMTDLGCLIAYLGPRTEPGKEQFRKHWARFERASLTFGRFARPDTRIFIDMRAHGQVEIHARAGIRPVELLAETWRLVAESYEDAWRLYCMALAKGDGAAIEFLQHKAITAKEREDVETAMGVASSERVDRVKAAAWAWREARLSESREEFLAGWNAHASSVAHLARWLDAPFTPKLLHAVFGEMREDDAFARLLRDTGIDAARWQQCREALGQPRYRFQSALDLWGRTLRQVCAVLRAALARLPGTNLPATQCMIGRLDSEEVQISLAEAPPDFSTMRVAVLETGGRLEVEGFPRSTEVAHNRLRALREVVASDPGELLVGKEPPDRDVREYRDVPEEIRAQQARQRFDLFASVASLLAPTLGETLDPQALALSENLPALIAGYWASRYSLVPIFQNELKKTAPKTLERMLERDAFRGDHTPAAFRALFPEVAQHSVAEVTKQPRRLNVAGGEMEEAAVEREMARGSAGSIGAALVAAAAAQGLSIFSEEERPELTPAARHTSGRRGGGGGAEAEADADKILNGELGEVFVFEWLKTRGFADFDPECWLSKNRCRYTGFAAGDDNAGCDFLLEDPTGLLPHRPGRTRCLIEVKSSAGDGLGVFRISESEWRRATESHFSQHEEYFIIRVAFVRSAQPRIVDVIRDPFALMTRSRLRFVGGDFKAIVAQPQNTGAV